MSELEREALLRAFDSGWVAPAGPEIEAFESDIASLTGWRGSVGVSSGTAALHLALLAAGVKPGDSVFVSTFTFAATANAVAYCGAVPIFIDSDRNTWNMSPEILHQALSGARKSKKLPSAVIAVDLYGQCADYDSIVPICRELGIPVIEDSAESLGSTYHGRPAGTLGDFGIFSFNGNKIITTSGGGMFLSPNIEVAEHVRYLATQARQPTVHYEHTEIGYNYRLSNLLAAIGRAQLLRLPQLVTKRLAINDQYRQHLEDIESHCEFMPIPSYAGWNGWLTCLLFESQDVRDQIFHALEAEDIESRPLWKPMHLQPVYRRYESFVSGVSENLFKRGLCVPSGSNLDSKDVQLIASCIKSAIRKIYSAE